MLFGTETERTMNSVRVMNKTREAWGIHYSRTQTTRRRLRSNINDIRALQGPGPQGQKLKKNKTVWVRGVEAPKGVPCKLFIGYNLRDMEEVNLGRRAKTHTRTHRCTDADTRRHTSMHKCRRAFVSVQAISRSRARRPSSRARPLQIIPC